jgi:ubiquinone/menaquinone biosynthesis C-methylase UbiE
MIEIANNIEPENMPLQDTAFEDMYIGVRRREKRVLTDCQVMFLPDIETSHIHYPEWKIRKRSSQKLVAWLEKKASPLKILEVGCGNGWLSSKLSAIPDTMVVGIDVNETEIDQAKRVFKKDNLEFIQASFNHGLYEPEKFDVIIFAASVQYFPSLKLSLLRALSCLSENGEIHIVDSHFYKPGKVNDAVRRTAEYYTALGYPEMPARYFHHTLNELEPFNYQILSNPGYLRNRMGKRNPFYWVVIKH